jgi:hypothetical protein
LTQSSLLFCASRLLKVVFSHFVQRRPKLSQQLKELNIVVGAPEEHMGLAEEQKGEEQKGAEEQKGGLGLEAGRHGKKRRREDDELEVQRQRKGARAAPTRVRHVDGSVLLRRIDGVSHSHSITWRAGKGRDLYSRGSFARANVLTLEQAVVKVVKPGDVHEFNPRVGQDLFLWLSPRDSVNAPVFPFRFQFTARELDELETEFPLSTAKGDELATKMYREVYLSVASVAKVAKMSSTSFAKYMAHFPPYGPKLKGKDFLDDVLDVRERIAMAIE